MERFHRFQGTVPIEIMKMHGKEIKFNIPFILLSLSPLFWALEWVIFSFVSYTAPIFFTFVLYFSIFLVLVAMNIISKPPLISSPRIRAYALTGGLFSGIANGAYGIFITYYGTTLTGLITLISVPVSIILVVVILKERYVKKQVGSSSMPSKRNPITSENVCSLSRIIRAYVTPEMEAAVQWHERDLTNSALERFTIPYSCILLDDILIKMNKILSFLFVNKEAMEKNLRESPLCISERLTIELALKKVDRQESHEIIREISMDFYSGKDKLRSILEKSPFGKYFTKEEMDNILDPHNFTGSSHEICMETIGRTKLLRRDNL